MIALLALHVATSASPTFGTFFHPNLSDRAAYHWTFGAASSSDGVVGCGRGAALLHSDCGVYRTSTALALNSIRAEPSRMRCCGDSMWCSSGWIAALVAARQRHITVLPCLCGWQIALCIMMINCGASCKSLYVCIGMSVAGQCRLVEYICVHQEIPHTLHPGSTPCTRTMRPRAHTHHPGCARILILLKGVTRGKI